MNSSKVIQFWGALILILLFHFEASAQGWDKKYAAKNVNGPTYQMNALSVVQTLDGGYAFSGGEGNASETNLQLSITKTDQLGTIQWSHIYGDTNLYEEAANDLIRTEDGGYIACGFRRAVGTFHHRTYIVKVNAIGTLVWEKEFGLGNNNQLATSIIPSSNGSFLICGTTGDLTPNLSDIFVMKIDSFGDSLWVKTYDGNDVETNQKIIETTDGGYLIGVQSLELGNPDGDGIYALKLDANFDEVWSNSYGGPSAEYIYDVEAFANGDVLIAGAALSASNNMEGYLIRVDATGNTIWENTYPTLGNHFNLWGSDLTNDGGVVVTGINIINGSVLLKIDGAGNELFSNYYPISDVGSTVGRDIKQTSDGGYIISGFSGDPADPFSFLLKTDSIGNIYSSRLMGNVFVDLDLNCALGMGDEGINQIILKIESDDLVFYTTSDSLGNYEILLDTGLYELSTIIPNSQLAACNASLQIYINDFYSDFTEDIPIQVTGTCPFMVVDIATPRLRPCFQNNYTISYANYGAPLLQSGSIEIEFDTLLTVISSSIPWLIQAGNVYTFDIGLLGSFENGSFTVTTELDCDPNIVGMTHCAIAHIFPDSICDPINPLWDGSSLAIVGNCIGDSAIFNVTNTGSGNMNNGADYLVIEDQLMLMQGMILLQAGEDTTFSFFPEGKTVRVEIEQSIGHPGNNAPSISLEGCGNGPFSPGFVTSYPEDDGNPFISIDCQESVASYDPNDKMGYPLGYGDQHFIEANTDIEYRIRFQNSGTDTAYYVEIIDTLPTLLDPETILVGTSSHPYSFELFGNGMIRFRFENILLPHEAIDEAGSNGFVKFKISQDQDNPIGSELFNSAAIYFDFNPPIITNISEHRIGEDFIEVFTDVKNNGSESEVVSLTVFPNPFEQTATFEMEGKEFNECQFELINVSGQALRQNSFTGNRFEFQRNDLPTGMYFYRISSEGAVLSSGKIMIK